MTNIGFSLHGHAENILLSQFTREPTAQVWGYDISFYNLPIAPHSIFTIYQWRGMAFHQFANCAAWHFNNLPIAPHGIFTFHQLFGMAFQQFANCAAWHFYNLPIAWFPFYNLFLLKSNAFFVLAS